MKNETEILVTYLFLVELFFSPVQCWEECLDLVLER